MVAKPEISKLKFSTPNSHAQCSLPNESIVATVTLLSFPFLEVEDGAGWLEDSGVAARWFVTWACHSHPEARVTSPSSM